MRIHVLYTGGTIGMIPSEHGLIPGADLAGWLDSLLDAVPGAPTVTLSSLTPLIDSSNATPENWQALIEEIRARATGAEAPQAFVVLHGTDTMAYTAAALAYALADLTQPVILTGSQLPLGALGSDAPANVTGALQAAMSDRTRGVTLFFGRHLLAGARATKSSSWAFEGFSSPACAPLARVGTPWSWRTEISDAEAWVDPAPYRSWDVPVIDMVPGLAASRLRAMVTPAPDALILRAFGVGNIPSLDPAMGEFLTELTQAGVAIVVASQCHEARVVLGHYETGEALAQAGAVGSGDMTLEATYAKVIFLLSQGLRGHDLAAHMTRNLAGELTRYID